MSKQTNMELSIATDGDNCAHDCSWLNCETRDGLQVYSCGVFQRLRDGNDYTFTHELVHLSPTYGHPVARHVGCRNAEKKCQRKRTRAGALEHIIASRMRSDGVPPSEIAAGIDTQVMAATLVVASVKG